MSKKLILLLGIILIYTVSCSVSKTNRTSRTTVDGYWTLNNISFENAGAFKATLFNDAEAICFEGSEWFFRANNSTGQYNLKSASICDSSTRYIRWSIVEGDPNQLQFKFTDEKKNDLTGSGYRLNISTLSDQQMILKSNTMADGENVTIVYEFTKRNN